MLIGVVEEKESSLLTETIDTLVGAVRSRDDGVECRC